MSLTGFLQRSYWSANCLFTTILSEKLSMALGAVSGFPATLKNSRMPTVQGSALSKENLYNRFLPLPPYCCRASCLVTSIRTISYDPHLLDVIATINERYALLLQRNMHVLGLSILRCLKEVCVDCTSNQNQLAHVTSFTIQLTVYVISCEGRNLSGKSKAGRLA